MLTSPGVKQGCVIGRAGREEAQGETSFQMSVSSGDKKWSAKQKKNELIFGIAVIKQKQENI